MAAPPGSLDRVDEAYRRAVVLLPDSFGGLNDELLRPGTELALVVVLGVWSGLDAPALGWMVGVIAQSKDSANLGNAGRALQDAVVNAANAKDEGELAQASASLATAIMKVGPARLGTLLGSDQFGQLRNVVSPLRSQLLLGALWPSITTAVPVPARTVPGKRRSLGWLVLGGATGIGALLIAIAHAPKRGR